MPLSFTKGLCAVLDDGSMPPYHLSCPKGTWQSQQCVITTWNCALILEIYSPHKILRFFQPTKLNCIKMWYRGTESLRIFSKAKNPPTVASCDRWCSRGFAIWQNQLPSPMAVRHALGFKNRMFGWWRMGSCAALQAERQRIEEHFERLDKSVPFVVTGMNQKMDILGWNIQLSWFYSMQSLRIFSDHWLSEIRSYFDGLVKQCWTFVVGVGDPGSVIIGSILWSRTDPAMGLKVVLMLKIVWNSRSSHTTSSRSSSFSTTTCQFGTHPSDRLSRFRGVKQR